MKTFLFLILFSLNSVSGFAQSNLWERAIETHDPNVILSELNLGELKKSDIEEIRSTLNTIFEIIDRHEFDSSESHNIYRKGGLACIVMGLSPAKEKRGLSLHVQGGLPFYYDIPYSIEVFAPYTKSACTIKKLAEKRDKRSIERSFRAGMQFGLIETKFQFSPEAKTSFAAFQKVYDNYGLSQGKNVPRTGEYSDEQGYLLLDYSYQYELLEDKILITSFQFEDHKGLKKAVSPIVVPSH